MRSSERPPYPPEFFDGLREASRRSARIVVPMVLEIVRPARVVDVGCGVGSWLAAFRETGVAEILGVDGEWVDPALLEFPRENFLARDLRGPLGIEGRFDLVLSLEVAEHLPPECADAFVTSLTGLGLVILFSAAVPFQGGFRHLNEQWPDYWVERFERRGYVAVDALRPRLWQNAEIEWWYVQNMLMFCRRDHLDRHPALRDLWRATDRRRLAVVHPRHYEDKCRLLSTLSDPRNLSLKALLGALPAAAARAVAVRLRRLSGR